MHRLPIGITILLLIISACVGLWEFFFINLALTLIQIIPRIVIAIKENIERNDYHKSYSSNTPYLDTSSKTTETDELSAMQKTTSVQKGDSPLETYLIKIQSEGVNITEIVTFSFEDKDYISSSLDTISYTFPSDTILNFKLLMHNDEVTYKDLLFVYSHLHETLKASPSIQTDNRALMFSFQCCLSTMDKYIK